jgi:hypothetical protein
MLHDVRSRDEFRRHGSGEEESIGASIVARADVAHPIEHAFHRQDSVANDQVVHLWARQRRDLAPSGYDADLAREGGEDTRRTRRDESTPTAGLPHLRVIRGQHLRVLRGYGKANTYSAL